MIGAKNRVDKNLVAMYENKQTINLSLVTPVSPEKIWKSLDMVAYLNKTHLSLKAC